MQPSSLLALALALCGAALAVPAPTTLPTVTVSPVPTTVEIAAAMTTPDCASLEEYCKCEDGDFNCETDPSCEWCREHNAWGNHSTTTRGQTG
ncbi:hypothetical protein F4804DRAFT_334233 [Jackrogersella minutella]|nr:hypothetical protein F4804DRAFT_334233 [Jackrogersella minutella]